MFLSKTHARAQGTSKKAQGFTLSEIGIVMGVVGIVAISVFAAAGALSNKRMLNQTTDQIGIIASNVRALYNGRSVPTASVAATTETAYLVGQNAGVFPGEMVSGTTVKNMWNGNVTVAIDATTPVKVIISYQNIPFDVCTDLLVRNSQPGRDTGLVKINLTDSAALSQDFVSNAANHQLPVLPITAATACKAGAEPFTMTWSYIIGNGCVAGTPC